MKKKQKAKRQQKEILTQFKKNVEIGIKDSVFVYVGPLTISEFAKKINTPVVTIIKYYFDKGQMLNQNYVLDEEQIGELCLELGYDFKKETKISHENILEEIKFNNNKEDFVKRPPIVTIMGHVDHGKTTLLDCIRSSKIADKEHGGITQQIGAYSINTKSNKMITFIDTPGHEAFTSMRSRGSSITDVVIIVVAADDGVKPQTIEAIDHAKAANVPIIVFVNKIDLLDDNKNFDNLYTQLSQHGIMVEEWGGEVPVVKGSAKNNINIDYLLENIILISEMQELRANPKDYGRGVVLESSLNKNLGATSTIIIQNGTVHKNDYIVAGNSYGRIKNMYNDKGVKINEASLSMPIKIVGLNEPPKAGDKFLVFFDEKLARDIANKRRMDSIIKNRSLGNQGLKLSNLGNKIKEGSLQELNFIIKTDTEGTLEALKSSLNKINIEGIKIKIVRSAVGGINSSDINLANVTNSIIIGFNVRPNNEIRKLAEEENVELFLETIIYKIIENIEKAAQSMLKPEEKEVVTGAAIVKKIFFFSKVGNIAGCIVDHGSINKNDKIRLIRNDIIVYSGVLLNMKHLQKDITTAKKGQECGITIKNYNDIKEDDIIEFYKTEIIK